MTRAPRALDRLVSRTVELAVAATLLAIVTVPVSAQGIRGTVTDDLTRRPILAALVTLLDSAGNAVPGITARTDSAGNFSVYARTTGLYQVSVARIGYRPATSPIVELGQTEIVRLRLSLTVVAQRVSPIAVVEKRVLTPVELDGRTGFAYRRARAFGYALVDSDLVGMGSLADIQRTGKVGAIRFSGGDALLDPETVSVNGCGPMLILDGHPVLPPPLSTGNGWKELDGRVTMDMIAGIEVYPKGRLPMEAAGFAIDPYVGGRPGFLDSCFIIVWTKSYFTWMDSVTAHESERSSRPSPR